MKNKTGPKLPTDHEVTMNDLKFGNKFWFQGDEFLVVEGPACREEGYAVNLTTFQLTYFWPNEGGMTKWREDVS